MVFGMFARQHACTEKHRCHGVRPRASARTVLSHCAVFDALRSSGFPRPSDARGRLISYRTAMNVASSAQLCRRLERDKCASGGGDPPQLCMIASAIPTATIPTPPRAGGPSKSMGTARVVRVERVRRIFGWRDMVSRMSRPAGYAIRKQAGCRPSGTMVSTQSVRLYG